MRKKVLLIATGGTIAQTEGEEGLTPTYTASGLLKFVSEIEDICEVHTYQLFNMDSTNMQPEYWEEIVRYIRKMYAEYHGFVLIHGTDTMGYSAAALTYMIQQAGKPIILTGSQQPIDQPGTDARQNLIDAVCLACENIGGVYVVFAGKVIRGTRAVKLRTKSRDAFESVNCPLVARIQNRRVQYDESMVEPLFTGTPQFYTSLCYDVGLLKFIPGTKTELLEFMGSRYRAVVLESYGNGGIPFDRQRDILSAVKTMIETGVIVAVTTQCLWEGSDLNVYEVGRKALQLSVLPAYDMTTEAIVAKLMWALAQTEDPAKVKHLFLSPVQGDIRLIP